MNDNEIYTYLRQAGFSHDEARAFINKGKIPGTETELKRKAIARLRQSTVARP